MTENSRATVSRRTVVKGSVLAAALASVPAGAQAGTTPSGVALVRNRLTLPSGIATGDVTSDSAVLWSRASGAGRMTAVLRAVDDGGQVLRGRGAFERVLRGPRATQASDFTAKIHAGNLPSNTRFALDISFEDDGGAAGETVRGSFRTAPDAGTINGTGRTGGTSSGGDVPASSNVPGRQTAELSAMGMFSCHACRPRAARVLTSRTVYRESSMIWPGYQLLWVSWSSHWAITGTSANMARMLASMELYRCRPRNSVSVSATLETSSVTRFRHTWPSFSTTLSAMGPSA
jgi:hypothetical protein